MRQAERKIHKNSSLSVNPQKSPTFPFHPQRSRCIPYGTSDRPNPSRALRLGARCKLVGAFGGGEGVPSGDGDFYLSVFGGGSGCFSGDIADKPIRLRAIKAAMSFRRCFARR